MVANTQDLLDELLSKEVIKMKDRKAIPLQTPQMLDPLVRVQSQAEVEETLTPIQAQLEAMRCIQCKKKPCVDACPVHIDIPQFIQEISEGKFDHAIDTIKSTSLLPAICGRVCPQEKQCQSVCTMGKTLKDVGLAVAIGKLERFAADYERNQGQVKIPEVAASTGKKVAIIGSGPAGLVVAADTCRAGHEVTIFEAFHKFGGVMRYGIPEFRLPNEVVDAEIETLQKMGVNFQANFVVGRTRTIEDLITHDGFDAVFVGTGAGLPLFTGIPGEDLVGVFAANEYLTRANLMGATRGNQVQTPLYDSKHVAVLGGGNVAMDACRMAKRMGAKKVSVIYRRGLEEMPARKEEIEHAMEEGIEFLFYQNIVEIQGDEEMRVKSGVVQRYELGEPDDSGRRRPIAIEGDTYELPIDTVLVAIGNGSNPLIPQTTPGLQTNVKGNLLVDDFGKTHMDRVFAGGDIVLGAATVILAMGEGRKAASAINEMLAQELICDANH